MLEGFPILPAIKQNPDRSKPRERVYPILLYPTLPGVLQFGVSGGGVILR